MKEHLKNFLKATKKNERKKIIEKNLFNNV